MANFKSPYADGQRQAPISGGAEAVAVRAEIAVTTALASADILEAMELPEDHVPVDFMVDADDLDGGAGLTLSVGVLNADKDDLSTAAADGGAVWMVDSTVGQAGGLVRPTTKTVTRVAPSSTTRRMLGLKVTTVAATEVAGVVGLTVWMRASHGGA
jgi:hypothetical protein